MSHLSHYQFFIPLLIFVSFEMRTLHLPILLLKSFILKPYLIMMTFPFLFMTLICFRFLFFYPDIELQLFPQLEACIDLVYIIPANTCEKEIILNKYQLCRNSNCNTTVNHDLFLLFMLHLLWSFSYFYTFFIF